MIVQQLLFGYKKGHQLLAGSVNLDEVSTDLATRLSDLSGSMTSVAEFHPYLTCYPLPQNDYYVISKTWIDATAPRAGCVLTHALLVPMELWKKIPDTAIFHSYLVKPRNAEDIESYRKEIHLSDLNSRNSIEFISQDTDHSFFKGFTYLFFGEGISPIVWFTDKHFEDHFWKITKTFWPELRGAFTCCTFSLQPRFLDNKPFDLMIAPPSAYSRFNQITRENIIEETNLSYTSQLQKKEEPWINEWAETLLGTFSNWNEKSSISDEMKWLSPYLNSNPTVIKKLYLIKELRKRSSNSPMAAIGILDLVESVAQNETEAIEYKEKMFKLALHSIQNSPDVDEKFKCLILISDRLKRKVYIHISSTCTQSLISEIAEQVSIDPIVAIKASEKLFAPQAELFDSPFSLGLVKGLVNIGTSKPENLFFLQNFPDASSILISIEPKIGLYYLQAADKESNIPDKNRIRDVVSWISKISDNISLERIRRVFLPEIKSDNYKLLADELLRTVEEQEVDYVLTALYNSTKGYKLVEVTNVTSDRVSRRYPGKTRNWATNIPIWSFETAEIVSVTYSSNREGLQELLSNDGFSSLRKAEILASFIEKISQAYSFPRWFIELAASDERIIKTLLVHIEPIPETVSAVIKHIVENILVLPIVQTFAPGDVSSFIVGTNYQFNSSLAAAAMRSSIANYLEGTIDWDTYKLWESPEWGNKWLAVSPIRDLRELIHKLSFQSNDSWKRSWKWFAECSENLYASNGSQISKLIEALISINPNQLEWDIKVTDYWVKIIDRVKKLSGKSAYLQVCSDALSFAFQHTELPVSKVVVSCFLPVYIAVTESDELPAETYNLFGYFDWDKGKELRKKVIQAFVESRTWAPGDLALSFREKPLLRKMYSRLKRYWNGKNYCMLILRDLSKREDSENVMAVYEELNSLINQRNFYEPWD